MGELADQKVAGHGENGLRVAGCSDGHGVYLRRGGLWHKCSLVSNGRDVPLPCPIQTVYLPILTQPVTSGLAFRCVTGVECSVSGGRSHVFPHYLPQSARRAD